MRRSRGSMRAVMAHELAHQWFGNLVTQANWDDVWLSEGFATFLGMKVSDLDLAPDRRGVARVIAARRMMARDHGPKARPVRKRMHAVEDMKDVYSGVVYQKGAAVLAMLEQWIGEEPFRQALVQYLREHAFRTATTADLARAIREETGVNVGPVLATFLDHSGVPTVSSRTGCPRSFGTSPDAAVPVCVVAADGRTCALAPRAELKAACSPRWWFGYAGGAGYYRMDPPYEGRIPLNELTPAEQMALALDELARVALP